MLARLLEDGYTYSEVGICNILEPHMEMTEQRFRELRFRNIDSGTWITRAQEYGVTTEIGNIQGREGRKCQISGLFTLSLTMTSRSLHLSVLHIRQTPSSLLSLPLSGASRVK
jgi:hypothetical protein